MVRNEFETMSIDELGGERNDVKERLKGSTCTSQWVRRVTTRIYYNNGVEQTLIFLWKPLNQIYLFVHVLMTSLVKVCLLIPPLSVTVWRLNSNHLPLGIQFLSKYYRRENTCKHMHVHIYGFYLYPETYTHTHTHNMCIAIFQ